MLEEKVAMGTFFLPIPPLVRYQRSTDFSLIFSVRPSDVVILSLCQNSIYVTSSALLTIALRVGGERL